MCAFKLTYVDITLMVLFFINLFYETIYGLYDDFYFRPETIYKLKLSNPYLSKTLIIHGYYLLKQW